jgi:hypothetical protein
MIPFFHQAANFVTKIKGVPNMQFENIGLLYADINIIDFHLMAFTLTSCQDEALH